MPSAEHGWPAILGCALIVTVAGGLRAEQPTAVPPQVEVVLVGRAKADSTLAGRVRSLFDPSARVTLRAASRLSPREVLHPSRAGTVFIWITVGTDGSARVFAATREASVTEARYLVREVKLDSGLDEIGKETLAQVAHSSATALWSRRQQTSRAELAAELDREAERASALDEAEPSGERPADARSETSAASAPSAPGSPEANQESPGTEQPGESASVFRQLDVRLGIEYAIRASGDEGVVQIPGAFATARVAPRLVLRVGAGYLMPQRFDAGPAEVRLSGASAEARASAELVGGRGPRARFDAGAGMWFVQWSAEAAPPAQALAGQSEQRGYVVAGLAVELPIGPLSLGARGELQVPFTKSRYFVLENGEREQEAEAWIAPGGAVELLVPLCSSDGKQ